MREIMATRSSSNKKITNRNANVMYAPPNRQNTQAVRQIPGVTYGEQDKLTEQQKIAPLPKASTPNVQAPSRPVPNIDVFGETEFQSEPVTAGLPFGAGVNPSPEEQTMGAERVKEFIFQSWLETGDDSLLEYI